MWVLGIAAKGADVAVECNADVVNVVVNEEHVVPIEGDAALSTEELGRTRHVLLLPVLAALT